MNTRKEYTYITSGIRKMKKPESVHVFLPNGERPLLSVIDIGERTHECRGKTDRTWRHTNER